MIRFSYRLWLCVRLDGTTTKCRTVPSHTGASSPRFLYQSEIFAVRYENSFRCSCKRGMTQLITVVSYSFLLYEGQPRSQGFSIFRPGNEVDMKEGVLLGTKPLVHTPFHPGPEWRIFRMSLLRVSHRSLASRFVPFLLC